MILNWQFILLLAIKLFIFLFAVVKLNTMIHVTGFTIEHVPKSLTPFGSIDSAPKNFSVWVSNFYYSYLLVV